MQFYLSEFHEEAFRKGMHDEGYEEGFSDGFDNGFNGAIVTFIEKSQSNNVPANAIITQLKELFSLSEQEATTLVNEHWT